MKFTIPVEVEVTVHGYDGKRFIPSLWMSYGRVDDESFPVNEIGVNMHVPTVYYLITREGHQGPNGSFVATVSFKDALTGVVSQWPAILERAVIAAEQEAAAAAVPAESEQES